VDFILAAGTRVRGETKSLAGDQELEGSNRLSAFVYLGLLNRRLYDENIFVKALG
jgi:hypothetical protein